MTDPIATPDELGVYFSDVSLDEERAQLLLDLAVSECETVISPLPAGARNVVLRVAARGYQAITSARQYQLEMADSAYGTQPGIVGGIYLTEKDEADLLRHAPGDTGSTAFSITPVYQPPDLLDCETVTVRYPW